MFNLFKWTLVSKSVTRGLHTNYPHFYELQKDDKIIRVKLNENRTGIVENSHAFSSINELEYYLSNYTSVLGNSSTDTIVEPDNTDFIQSDSNDYLP